MLASWKIAGLMEQAHSRRGTREGEPPFLGTTTPAAFAGGRTTARMQSPTRIGRRSGRCRPCGGGRGSRARRIRGKRRTPSGRFSPLGANGGRFRRDPGLVRLIGAGSAGGGATVH